MIRLFRFLALTGLLLGLTGLLGAVGVYAYLVPKLPPTDSLQDVQLQVPLRVYTRDGALVAEFGEKRRTPVTFDEVPERMVQAVLAAEDDRFYDHPGVDWQGLLRAVWHIVRTGEKGPGGSTITMQVARNFFLGREKTYIRKLNEILLAIKIERELTKNEILELYLNKIFLGQRAYGVGAAAQVYYGTDLANLTLPQYAMIAGLPKAPSRFNPVVNPSRATERRNYVLGRMHELGYITDEEYAASTSAPVSASVYALEVEVNAPYAAEMARAFVEERYGEEAYSSDYRVHLTIDAASQRAANAAVRKGLLDYDRRHGFRGPELHVDLPADEDGIRRVLADLPTTGGLLPAMVTAVGQKSVTAYTRDHGSIEIGWEGLEWARRYISEDRRGAAPEKAADIVAPGDVIRVQREAPADAPPEGEEAPPPGWRLAQIPEVEGALIALDSGNGGIRALVGGFDFFRSKFNRAVQAERQPGSNFKPFVYAAAMDKGFTPASIVNDAPVVFEDAGAEAMWRPENYSGKFFGPTRLRLALTKSRNLVSIRLLNAIGVDYAVDYVQRFGFEPGRLPRNLTLALGSATVTPRELVRGYAVLSNGGFLVEPFIIDRITEGEDKLVYETRPKLACEACVSAEQAAAMGLVATATEGGESGDGDGPRVLPPGVDAAPRVISAQTAWLMTSILGDVIKYGTGRKALVLGRDDLAGKTGTTNDQIDAWFSGYNAELVATVWVGFDQLRELGRRETGSAAALPVWIDFMREALRDRPESVMEQPSGLVTVRIDPDTGMLAAAGDPDAIFETFPADSVPQRVAGGDAGDGGGDGAMSAGTRTDAPEQLF